MKKASESSPSTRHGDCCTLNVSSLESCASTTRACPAVAVGEDVADGRLEAGDPGWILERMSIFSSFSSNRSLSSFTSVSNALTRSSKDSVYPLGKALRLSLSLVLHSNPTLAHCEQQGVMPSHLIFLLRHLSHACAILLCALVPTLITFIGRIPGMIASLLFLFFEECRGRTEMERTRQSVRGLVAFDASHRGRDVELLCCVVAPSSSSWGGVDETMVARKISCFDYCGVGQGIYYMHRFLT